MRATTARPQLHLFVCCNRRPEGDPLGPGCGKQGEVVYEELKLRVGQIAATSRVWVTRTFCLGVCPRRGSTVAVYPRGEIWSEVTIDNLNDVFHVDAKVSPQ